MSLKQYLILISVGSVITWITWVIVLFSVNPFESGALGFTLFYITLSVACIGTLALMGFGVRMAIYRHEGIVLRQVTTAFRQSIFLTMILIGSLILQSHALLAWWNILIFIAGVTILEFFFLSSRFSR